MSEDPIKVLHPITRLIVGGAQENTMYTAAMLDKDKYNVRIVSGPQTGSEGSLIDEVLVRDISIEIIPELVRQINPLKDGIALLKLFNLIREGHYDIVHTHSSKAGVLGRIAAQLAGTPIIIHAVHGWSFHSHMELWRKRVYVNLEKMVARFSDCLIVVAEVDIKKGLDEGIGKPEQYQLIRSAIPLAEFNPDSYNREDIRRQLGLPIGAPVLGNVGRFSRQKNPLDWVDVASVVSEEISDCFFLLVGDGPLRLDVEDAFERAGLLNRCIFTGLRRDVGKMMAVMDVFLLTSLWEGLPRVIPQAMAIGLPIVANKADGTINVIQHGYNGYLCEPGMTDEMAQYCIQLLLNKELRKEMGDRAQKSVDTNFDINKMIQQIECLYERLIREKELR